MQIPLSSYEAPGEKLGMCPVCKKAYWSLAKYAPDVEHMMAGWRVSCHGCSISTFRCTTKTEAMGVFNVLMGRLSELARGARPRGDHADQVPPA